MSECQMTEVPAFDANDCSSCGFGEPLFGPTVTRCRPALPLRFRSRKIFQSLLHRYISLLYSNKIILLLLHHIDNWSQTNLSDMKLILFSQKQNYLENKKHEKIYTLSFVSFFYSVYNICIVIVTLSISLSTEILYHIFSWNGIPLTDNPCLIWSIVSTALTMKRFLSLVRKCGLQRNQRKVRHSMPMLEMKRWAIFFSLTSAQKETLFSKQHFGHI